MKKSLLLFIGLIIIYEVVIRSVDVWWTSGQNQWQANRIVVDNFLFRTKDYPNIMVGSSLAARFNGKISKDSLPGGLYNLALSGQSLFDGLLILKESGYIPQNLYIETNIINRDEDRSLQKALFSPIPFNMKKLAKSWRDNYQPVELLFRYRPRKPTEAELAREIPPARNEGSYQKMLALQVEKGAVRLNDEVLNASISKLKGLIIYFQQRGTKVTLFEMPVDPAVCSSQKVLQIRTRVKQVLVPLKCKFIEIPNCDLYRTTDGVHLEVPSVYLYLRYFRKAINQES